ncbi:golgin, RAB6 interacting [Anticarsia gemmatalis]|uniref:golgin, RAB6 interacting n=1 Tax=Anticarsia gemmatalis TaxID=129554 RepID=UPI003F777E29
MSSFSGFSEEELKRIKSGETGADSAPQIPPNNLKPALLGKQRYVKNMKLKTITKQNSDDAIDNIDFEKCKLSIRSPSTPKSPGNIENENKENLDKNENIQSTEEISETTDSNRNGNVDTITNMNTVNASIDRKYSTDFTPDIVRGVENYSEDELANHKAKLEELQLRQKLMEEQNKKRKEMLAKALADRTKQTAEEVMRLEKIKKELQVLDSQFSQDVSVLRGKIDQACLSYADAEKHYLKVEKEFLQAKIHLQKEKEKKELLTEHLCALITHNETRKAQKLETLMLELATDAKVDEPSPVDEKPVIVDGVDERTGKIVEISDS